MRECRTVYHLDLPIPSTYWSISAGFNQIQEARGQGVDTEKIGAEEWSELQRNLEESIPVYDRINRFATLGQVSRWRSMVRDRLPQNGRILEVGCGPGSFAEDVVGRTLVCLDPIPVSYTHLRAHETREDLVCRLLLEKKK